MSMGSSIPKGGDKPAKISVPAKSGSPATHDCKPIGKAPGSAIPGFSGSGMKPSKV